MKTAALEPAGASANLARGQDDANISPVIAKEGRDAQAGADLQARIGPNAIWRLAEAVRDMEGREAADRLFGEAGLPWTLDNLPADMVDERTVFDLHRALARTREREHAIALAADAGRRTAHYLLENRIPRWTHPVLRTLPAQIALPILAKAMAAHAWTFAGSARFTYDARIPGWLHLDGGMFAFADAPRPCLTTDYAVTVETLFAALIRTPLQVTVTPPGADAASRRACRLVITRR